MKLRIEALEIEISGDSPFLDRVLTIAEKVAAALEHAPAAPANGRKPREKKEKPEAAPDTAPAERPVDAAVAAQDAADERPQTSEPSPATLDDVRAAWLDYAKVFGFAKAAMDMQGVIGYRIEDIPDTPQDLAAALAKINVAIAAGAGAAPKKAETSKPVEKPAPASADRHAVMDAFRRYAKAFDGQSEDLSAAVHTKADGKRILQQLFGDKCAAIGDIPATADCYGRAVAAIDYAIANDTFSRGGAKQGGVGGLFA